MRAVQDIIFGVAGQLLVCDAFEGRPSAVTSITIYRWDQSDTDANVELAVSGVASVEATPNTTTDAVCGQAQTDTRRVPLTLTTGAARDRYYLITDTPTGKFEWFEPWEIAADDYVIARSPLHNDYSIGATVQSTRMVATVDATWAADLTNLDESAGANPMFRARWVYVVGGKTYVADTYFTLSRYDARHGVLPQNVDDMCPGWLSNLPLDHQRDQGRRLIAEAYRAVKLDMHGLRLDATQIAESEVVDELVRLKAIELSEWCHFLAGQGVDEGRFLLAQKMYTTRYDGLLKLVMNVPVRDRTGAASKTTAAGFGRR